MNKDRRTEINKAIGMLQEALSILETARDEEQEYYDNMPESLQGSGASRQQPRRRVQQPRRRHLVRRICSRVTGATP